MNLVRKMMRHGSVMVWPGVASPRIRERAIKKGTPYRRCFLRDGRAFHATKGTTHDRAVLSWLNNPLIGAA